MRKYYTRACNFSYGLEARDLIKKKLALPLCGNKNIAFKQIEILSRVTKSKIIDIKNISKLSKSIKIIISKDLKKIICKRQNLNRYLNFKEPLIMGVLNLTPDSFSDGGLFNKEKRALSHIKSMIDKGANDWNGGLYHACYRGNIDIVNLMIEKGANDCRYCNNTKHTFN